MTRTREVWRPDKLVCKRFNVPDPFFGQIAAPKGPAGSGAGHPAKRLHTSLSGHHTSRVHVILLDYDLDFVLCK
jgi:hypothetical protein